MPTVCKEIVIYEIKSESEVAFFALHEKNTEALKTRPGFISHQREKAQEKPYHFMDIVTWESFALAKAAFDEFKHLPYASEFTATIKKVIYSGHF